jgi:anti-sigma factor RsiW
MRGMKCQRARSMLSPYLDGAVTGVEMQSIAGHLRACRECSLEYAQLQRTQHMLAGLGRKKAPPELALQIRVALSQQASSQAKWRLEVLAMRFRDALNAFMLPATAGVISAVIFFGMLIGVLMLPEGLSAAQEDVPTMLYTPPQLQALPAGVALDEDTPEAVVVETLVGANGRVQDYRILSGPAEHPNLRPQLNNIMIFTTFRPATSFGVPTSGRVVLSFSNINVKG